MLKHHAIAWNKSEQIKLNQKTFHIPTTSWTEYNNLNGQPRVEYLLVVLLVLGSHKSIKEIELLIASNKTCKKADTTASNDDH